MTKRGRFSAGFKACVAPEAPRGDKKIRDFAARDLAEFLAVPFGNPLFFIENLRLDTGGRTLAVSPLYPGSDRYAYKAGIEVSD